MSLTVAAFVLLIGIITMVSLFDHDAFASTAPTISITSPANGATFNTGKVTITGTASAPGSSIVSVEVSVDNGPFNLASGTLNWSYTTSLTGGTHTIVARVTDNGANTATTPSNSILTTIGGILQGGSVTFDPANGNLYVANMFNVFAIDGNTNTISGTIPAGPSPSQVAVNPTNGYLYIINDNIFANSVTVFDPASNGIITTIALSGTPENIVFDPANGNLYVSRFDGSVSVINGITNTVSTNISLGSVIPGSIVFDSSNGYVYVSSGDGSNDNKVSIIDGSANTLVGSISFQTANIFGMVFDPSNNNIYVGLGNQTVDVVNDVSNTIVSSIATPGGGGGPMVYDSANGGIYVDGSDGKVWLLSDKTNSVITTIPVNSLPNGIAFDSSNGNLYVSRVSFSDVAVIPSVFLLTNNNHPSGDYVVTDVGEGLLKQVTQCGVVSTIAGPRGADHALGPFGVAIDSDGNYIVTNNEVDPGSLVKITPSGTVTMIDNFGTNSNPSGIAIDSDGNYIVELYENGGTLVKITPSGTMTTITTGLGNPIGIAIDANGNYIITDSTNLAPRLLSVTPGGVVTVIVQNGLEVPSGIAIDANGNYIVGDQGLGGGYYGSLLKITPSGMITTILSGNGPNGVAIDSDGNYIVGFFANHVLAKVTPSGIMTTIASDGLANLYGIAIKPGPAVSCNTDATPPVITPTITGTLGNNGWYTNDVTVSWSVTDPESAISSSTGCVTGVINTDTAGTTLTCSATSVGGTDSQSITIKRDATPPTITAPPSITLVSSTPVSPPLGAPTVSDNLDPSPIVTNNAPVSFAPGSTITVSWTATDQAGNFATATQQVTIQTPAQAITGLTNTINGMSLPTGEQSSLGATLKNIDTTSPSSCGKLNAFESKVNTDLSHGKLTTQAGTLLYQANAIKSAIGCK